MKSVTSSKRSDQKRARSVVITGAASGLGRALARTYAARGDRLMLGDIDVSGLEALTRELTAKGAEVAFRPCDVCSDTQVSTLVDAAVAQWGTLDVIVNNAGVAAHGAIDQSALDDWRWIVDINLMGVVRGCNAASAVFKRQGHGSIINVASMAGLLSSPDMSAYNTTKAAVVALSETLHSELSAYGIGVSVVCPGFFATGLTNTMRSPMPGMDVFVQKLMARSSLTADDVARIVVDAAARGPLYILPHFNMRPLWWAKRAVPVLYFHGMKMVASRIKQKAEKAPVAQSAQSRQNVQPIRSVQSPVSSKQSAPVHEVTT